MTVEITHRDYSLIGHDTKLAGANRLARGPIIVGADAGYSWVRPDATKEIAQVGLAGG